MTCLETIKIKNKQFQNIHFHNERFNRTQQLFLKSNTLIDLSRIIEIPDDLTDEIYKCRVVYSNKIKKVEFQKYVILPIQSLQVVEHNEINYSYKYTNRELLSELFQQRKMSDDILIVKNGLITDSYYCNVAFRQGEKWWTPRSPLLKGTQRAHLIQQNIIEEKEIKLTDLQTFSAVKLFNAMIDWEEAPCIFIQNVCV